MQPEGSDLCNVVYTPEPNQRVLMPYHEAVPIGTSRPVTDHTVSGEAPSDRLTWPRRRFIERVVWQTKNHSLSSFSTSLMNKPGSSVSSAAL